MPRCDNCVKFRDPNDCAFEDEPGLGCRYEEKDEVEEEWMKN